MGSMVADDFLIHKLYNAKPEAQAKAGTIQVPTAGEGGGGTKELPMAIAAPPRKAEVEIVTG